MGAEFYLAGITGKDGKLVASGGVPLDQNRVNANWYLWEGERPAVHSYAKKPGYIAVNRRMPRTAGLSAGKGTGTGSLRTALRFSATAVVEPRSSIRKQEREAQAVFRHPRARRFQSLCGNVGYSRLGGIHGGKKNAPDYSGAITFSGTFSGTLVGARSGAGAGAGVWAGFGTVSGMSIGVEPG